MNVGTKTVDIAQRRKVIEAAKKLAGSHPGNIAAYEEMLKAVGELWTEDFGVDCNVKLECDKEYLAAKLTEMGKANG